MYRRRSFIASALSFAAAPALAQDTPGLEQETSLEDIGDATKPAWIVADIPPGATVFVSPGGEGSGLTWAEAAPPQAIGDLASRVGPGGQVLLLADSGPLVISDTIVVAAAGSVDAPLRIAGAKSDGTPATATLVGSRTVWSPARSEQEAVDASTYGGNTLFKLAEGAAFLRFEHLRVEHFGTVLNMAGVSASDVTVEDVEFLNIRDGIYTDSDSAVARLFLRRFCGHGFSKKAVRFHGRSSDWLIEDCELDSGWQYGDDFAVGIEANDEANGLHILGGSTTNCMDTQRDNPEGYWNGDGVASERGNFNILIENHRSSGHTDAGYDLKSEATELRRCVSEDNKRNYRLWGGIGAEPILLTGCSSLAPRKRGGTGGMHHIWVSGASDAYDDAGSVLFADGTISGPDQDDAIFADGGNAAIHLVDATISGLDSATLFTATEDTSTLIVGSSSDTGLRQILTEQNVTLVTGIPKSVLLEADAEASWRIVDRGEVNAVVEGSVLVLVGGGVDVKGDVVVQARDSSGRPTRVAIATTSVRNPVAEGAVLALSIDADGTISDGTGIHVIIPSEDAEVVDGTFHFRGETSYFEIEKSANFALDGAFWIETTFEIGDQNFDLPADIVTVWKSSGNDRSFLIGLSEDRAITFAWSTTGRFEDEAMLVGPVLKPATFYTITVDRGSSGVIRLYVDGVMVAQTTESVGPLFHGDAPLRVTGRPDGKYGASGYMKSLTIVKGSAKCQKEASCVTL